MDDGRVPYGDHGLLRDTDNIIVRKRGGGERTIPSHKWWINRNTPPGDDALLWERMPHQGKREIPFSSIIAVIRAPNPIPKDNPK